MTHLINAQQAQAEIESQIVEQTQILAKKEIKAIEISAQLEEEEDADGVVQYLYHQAKASVKNAAIPVLKASGYQMKGRRNKLKY